LKGEIPSQINHLEHLQVLSLYKHHIAGGIPPIGKLQNLKILQLSVKNMSGPLPKELYSLENLEILDIHDNNFVGTISHDIENTKALELLSLYNNKFDCEIPWASMSILEILSAQEKSVARLFQVTSGILLFLQQFLASVRQRCKRSGLMW